MAAYLACSPLGTTAMFEGSQPSRLSGRVEVEQLDFSERIPQLWKLGSSGYVTTRRRRRGRNRRRRRCLTNRRSLSPQSQCSWARQQIHMASCQWEGMLGGWCSEGPFLRSRGGALEQLFIQDLGLFLYCFLRSLHPDWPPTSCCSTKSMMLLHWGDGVSPVMSAACVPAPWGLAFSTETPIFVSSLRVFVSHLLRVFRAGWQTSRRLPCAFEEVLSHLTVRDSRLDNLVLGGLQPIPRPFKFLDCACLCTINLKILCRCKCVFPNQIQANSC